MQKLSKFTALLSLHPLKTYEKDERKLHLRSCIDGFECFQLLFVPNALCGFELDMESLVREQIPLQRHSHSGTQMKHIQDILSQTASTLNLKADLHSTHSVVAHNRKPLLPDHREVHTEARLSDPRKITVPKNIDSLTLSFAPAAQANSRKSDPLPDTSLRLNLNPNPVSPMNKRTKIQHDHCSEFSYWLTLAPSPSASVAPFVQNEGTSASKSSARIVGDTVRAVSSNELQLRPAATVRMNPQTEDNSIVSKIDITHEYFEDIPKTNVRVVH
uniref:AlNc14C206G8827 protein n=1 Tax=Albugo laibachii Nc14 TaxID=890382 RepID=F0WR19_9STRA|nr:AlNc14C206G8827 [Albugo laibachii Nc14]|eukprot:CCA23779.1 AlNc14C206G8827 [Albugo laibachii Nc14]